jgi:hypothetical protein
MNKKWLPHSITAGVLAVFIVLGLACASTPTPHQWADVQYSGEDSPLLEGTTWTYINRSSGYTRTVEFRSGGKLVVSGWGNSTWERRGNTVRMVVDNGYYSWEGTYYADTKRIMGSGQNSEGDKWDLTLELMQGSSVSSASGAAASGPSSRTYTVTVWYTVNGTRMSAPVIVTASSKDEAEREAERQWKNTNGWNQSLNFVEAVAPSY